MKRSSDVKFLGSENFTKKTEDDSVLIVDSWWFWGGCGSVLPTSTRLWWRASLTPAPCTGVKCTTETIIAIFASRCRRFVE